MLALRLKKSRSDLENIMMVYLNIPSHLDHGNWYIMKFFIVELAQSREKNF